MAPPNVAELRQAFEKERKQAVLTGEANLRSYMADRAVDAPTGCGFCRLFGQRARTAAADAAPDAAAVGAAGQNAFGARGRALVFGKKKASATSKLEQAAVEMGARVEDLEARMLACRKDAARLHAAGQKTQALRMLKKSKGYEKTLLATQSALDAVDQQVELLAQAEMQKKLASALGSTSKQLKGDKKILAKAESAVDDVADARDVAADLSDVLAGFVAPDVADEDDLLAELEGLGAEFAAPPPPPQAEIMVEVEEAPEARALRETHAKQRGWDEAEAARQAIPAVPAGERAQLLPA